ASRTTECPLSSTATAATWASPRRVPTWSRFGTRRASGRRLSVARLTRAVKKHVADTTPIMKTKQFDWHADPIPRTTPVTSTYRNTQNVRRFLQSQCGASFQSSRRFMTWIKDGAVERPIHFAERDRCPTKNLKTLA